MTNLDDFISSLIGKHKDEVSGLVAQAYPGQTIRIEYTERVRSYEPADEESNEPWLIQVIHDPAGLVTNTQWEPGGDCNEPTALASAPGGARGKCVVL